MPKKLLHIITGLGDGGAEGVLTRLCLNSSKMQHVIISLTDEGRYGPTLAAEGVKVYSLGMSPRSFSFKKFWQLVRLIHNEKPSAVQTWMYHADLLGGLAARLSGVKMVFWGVRHSTLERGTASRLTILIARVCAALSYVVPHQIICCAESARDVHTALGYQKRKLIVIPNGYDISRFKKKLVSGQIMREAFGVSDAEVLVGMVGRFAPQKDHVTLLRAIAVCTSKNSLIRCLLVGRGMEPSNQLLVELIRQLNIEGNVILAGQQADIPAVMSGLDIHVLSSKSGEGFPNVVAESMACETPAVSTDVGDAALIVGREDCICQPNSPNALADIILGLIDEMNNRPDEWRMRGKNCRSRVVDGFSLERAVKSFEAVWDV